MKNLFLVLTISLFAKMSFASGKLSAQANMYENGHTRPVFGLSVYEPIMSKNIAFNSWTGYGVQFLETQSDVNWFVTKAQLDVRVKSKWVVAPGIAYKWLPDTNVKQSMGYIKVDYSLW